MKTIIQSLPARVRDVLAGGEDIPIPKPVSKALGSIVHWVMGTNRVFLTRIWVRSAAFMLVFVSFVGWSLGVRPMLAVSETDLIRLNPESDILQDPSYDEEILWFARLIYSETKNVHEQIYVAWVARNRVETGFRGNTYKQVALARNQFSGLNHFDRNYAHNINLDFNDKAPGWNTAIEVARLVYDAPEIQRPFPKTVRHFYSPIAISAPHWAYGGEAVHEIKDVHGRVRFAFYDGVE